MSLGIFSVVPPSVPCALRSTQPLKVSTRNFSWGKGGRYVWMTTYHTCSAETSRLSGALTYPEPLGPPRPVTGHLYFTSPFRVWNIALYGAESLTLRNVDQKSPGSSEMWSWRRTGKISWIDRVRNEQVLHRVKVESILNRIKRRGNG